MKISIIGCGWLGLPLAKHLAEEGHAVSGSTTRAERIMEIEAVGANAFQLKAENSKWLEVGLTDFLECDVLIIAIPPGTKRNPDSSHAEEVQSLMHVISDAKINIQKIIYISSTSIYKNSNRVVTEADVVEEADAENKILFRAEKYIQSGKIKDKIILRLGGLTGYDRMLARFFAGKSELAGGNEPVNLIHRDDVIAVILFLLKRESGSIVLNVCSPQHPSRKDFYTELCERFALVQPIFPEQLYADWKEISTNELAGLGYSWIFPDPYQYSYTY
ncbi:MAG TPA: NAD(P)-binding domain-containing protein [Cytophaga sp.]|nr:NAD(P)-binding domain-containing protein [Cytophaga sp.]